MAVLDLYPGLEVEILVDDIPTREYNYRSDTIPPPCHVTKYIVARIGASFAIRYTISRNFRLLAEALLANVYCDGNYVDSYVWPEDIYCMTGHIITLPDTRVDGVLCKQVFMFGASQNAEGEEGKVDLEGDHDFIISQLGNISINFQFAKHQCPELLNLYPRAQDDAGNTQGWFLATVSKSSAQTHRAK